MKKDKKQEKALKGPSGKQFVNKSIRLGSKEEVYKIDNDSEKASQKNGAKKSEAKKTGDKAGVNNSAQKKSKTQNAGKKKVKVKKKKSKIRQSLGRFSENWKKKTRNLPIIGKVLQARDKRVAKRREKRAQRRQLRKEKLGKMNIFQKSFYYSTKVISIVLFFVSIYLIVAPFAPELDYRLRKMFGIDLFGNRDGELVAEVLGDQDENSSDSADDLDLEDEEEVNPEDLIPDGNRLIIPSIGVDVAIVEGDDEDTLSRGAWRRPKTSTPDKGGNTVLTGHRFQYKPPNNKTFYNLDKVQLDDEIVVYWFGTRHSYKVSSIFEVEPDQIEIEDDTDYPILTLYTCTPLWTAKKRLVVIAEPI
ncbi:sortase [Candidatus Dojkabacteria bacterium]|nr:sortase [Candidatus Dojkabacteria bacterium]